MATGRHSSYKRVMILVHFKRTPNQRIQTFCATLRRQRKKGAPQPQPTVYFRQKETQTSLHILHRLSPHADKAPLGFPASPPPKGHCPKRPKSRGRERAPGARVGSHMPLPARGGTTLSRLRRNAGKGGRALITLAHTHSPGRAEGPHPLSTPSAAAGAECTGQAATSSRPAGRPAAQRMAPNCHPPARPARPLPPPPPHAPRAAASPLTRLTFSANPLTAFPAHSPSGSLSRRKVPRIGEGNHRIQ